MGIQPHDLSFEYPRASRRNRTGNRNDQVRRRQPGFRDNPVFFFLFLHPIRHPFGAAHQTEIFSTTETAERADVQDPS